VNFSSLHARHHAEAVLVRIPGDRYGEGPDAISSARPPGFETWHCLLARGSLRQIKVGAGSPCFHTRGPGHRRGWGALADGPGPGAAISLLRGWSLNVLGTEQIKLLVNPYHRQRLCPGAGG
jgi:hypothetical protein